MKDIPVSEMMVPLTEYATVGQEATLYDAVCALETAQARRKEGTHSYRAILVHDEDGQIVGKLDQFDILEALERDYPRKIEDSDVSPYRLDRESVKLLLMEHDFWSMPLDQLCVMAGRRTVADVMHTLAAGESVRREDTLQEAAHHFVLGRLHSLLVTDGREVVGILRLSDVFAEICNTTKRVHAR